MIYSIILTFFKETQIKTELIKNYIYLYLTSNPLTGTNPGKSNKE